MDLNSNVKVAIDEADRILSKLGDSWLRQYIIRVLARDYTWEVERAMNDVLGKTEPVEKEYRR